MGQTANQRAAELLGKIKNKIKQRKEEKKQDSKAGGAWWENHDAKDCRTTRCKEFGKYF